MAERQFKLSEKQVNELQWAYDHCTDGPTKVRYQAVRLYGSEYSVPEIKKIVGCSRPSLLEWCRKYTRIGLAGLLDQRTGGNRAKLRATEIEQIQRVLHTYTPQQWFGSTGSSDTGQFWTVGDLAKLVEQQHAVTYKCLTSYRQLFDKCEFSRQRPGHQYYSRSEAKVMTFEETLEKNW
jgi:transposase